MNSQVQLPALSAGNSQLLSDKRASAKRLKSVVRSVAFDFSVFLLLTLVSIRLLYACGALTAAFGAEPDESAHYVTSLMIRDFIASGELSSPVHFAERFYLHYPRVAFGLWPPLFHIFGGIWMFFFGATRLSVFAGMASLASCWAFLMYRMLRPVFGWSAALTVALLLVSLPAVQPSTSAVMLDLPLALVMLLALRSYACYLHDCHWKHALKFSIWSSVAILTKYNGVALALVPPLCVLFGSRYDLLKRWTFYLPAPVTLALVAPWYISMAHLVVYAMESGDSPNAIWPVAFRDLQQLFFLAGPVAGLFCIIGMVITAAGASRFPDASARLRGLLTASAALIGAVWTFHAVLYPIAGPRYLLPAAPAILLLALTALKSSPSQTPLPGRIPAFSLGIALIALAHMATFQIPRKTTVEFVQAADRILANKALTRAAILVSSDSAGEGMLVAEIAMRDQRPSHTVVRASKVLARSRLMGDRYQLLYRTEEEQAAVLDAIPVSLAVLDECSAQLCGDHHPLLGRMLARRAPVWKLTAEIPKQTGGVIRIYERTDPPSNRPTVRIDMQETLGRYIE